MQRAFRTFIGVDLGGGKGKTTAVARLRLSDQGVVVDDFGDDKPWYDDRLIAYLLRHAGEAVIAIDAPLTLTACTRCTLPTCPTTERCDVPAVRWLRERHARLSQMARMTGTAGMAGQKPRYTPYTQRATEVVLHEDFGILPRETLGQGMGPLTARAAYLRRALAEHFTLNRDLLEVYPKATLAQLFPDAPEAAALPAPRSPEPGALRSIGVTYKDGNGRPLQLYRNDTRNGGQVTNGASGRVAVVLTLQPAGQKRTSGPENPTGPESPEGSGTFQNRGTFENRGKKEPLQLVRSQIARHYKRSGHATPVREQILRGLPGLSFGPGQWQEFVLQNDHQLDALLCAYTAFLWARDGWDMPKDPVFTEDGWIWFPPKKIR